MEILSFFLFFFLFFPRLLGPIPAASYVGAQLPRSSVPGAELPPPLLSLCCPKQIDEWSKIFSDVPGVSECSVVLSVPLPTLPWSEGAQAGLMEVLLEEWLLKPLQSLATVRPVAEFYRLKRKMMDSPFKREPVAVSLRRDSQQGFAQMASLSDRPSSPGGRSVCGDL